MVIHFSLLICEINHLVTVPILRIFRSKSIPFSIFFSKNNNYFIHTKSNKLKTNSYTKITKTPSNLVRGCMVIDF
nr:MAG TPA: hypothetical protein [Caudoviricetes sp.]